jgi:hypothetical protein
MKNVLIPTDFSIRSLKLINAAVNRFGPEKLNIILVHALIPDHSISGLLMLNKRLDVHKLYSEEFMEACEVLRNKYGPIISKLKVEFYYGTSSYYLKNYMAERDIQAVLLAEDYAFRFKSPSGRDMKPMLLKSGYPVFRERIMAEEDKSFARKASISELLPT